MSPTGELSAIALLTAMVTPSVLISAAGLLILSTTNRLARIVDRARWLSQELEALDRQSGQPFAEERQHEIERQLAVRARRSRLVQSAVTSLYLAVGLFVATTLALVAASLLPALAWLPAILGITGAVVLFSGCVQLIRETRLALHAVDEEMNFVLRLRELRRGC